MKDKIILKDGFAFEIEQSSNSETFQVSIKATEEIPNFLKKLTPDNLSQYQVVNQDGLTVARPRDKEFKTCSLTAIWNGNTITEVLITVCLSDVNMIDRRLTAVEETASVLVMEGLLGGEE